MKQPQHSSLAFAVLATLASGVHAQDNSAVTISGFGTAALTATNTDDAEFARPNQATGVKTSPRPNPDSNFGIQATAKYSDDISFTAQGLVRENGPDTNFGGTLAWAFAKFKVNDELSFRVGRIGLPIYMISDFRNVGYANTMLRPPAEVYGQVAADNVDGADVVYQHSINDDTTLTSQFVIGHTRSRSPTYTGEFHPATALNLVLETGPFSFRFGRADAPVTLEDAPSLVTLDATLNAVGLSSIANQLPLKAHGSFTSLGMTMDYKNVLVQSEYAQRKTGSRLIGDTTSWYLMLGYRVGKFTPYFDHADETQNSLSNFDSLPTTGPLAPLAAAANGAVKVGLRSTNTLGVRWDFYKSAALKVQVDRISPKDGTAGSFINPAPGFAGPVTVYAAGVDFVF